jgi:hypothetical protein
MTKLLYISIGLLFCMMSLDCHYSSNGPSAPKRIPSLSDSGITGSWRWISSQSQGHIVGPDSPGYQYNIMIKFSDDSMFRFFRSDTLIESANYHIYQDSTGSLQDSVLQLDRINLFKLPGVWGSGYLYPSNIYLAQDTLLIAPQVSESGLDKFVLIQ